ncbi:hypothetical protein M8997_004160 [Phyllobacterium sp. 21LDTY02-6]|uniref:hypothetical protein n=1 Tax=Phyllobacterium sp. 21LDTY02-6 TaxID=2944903 RepID=UPI0020218B36|nr:hypothetical protein [Phyllobacterium sp. 21LDTY02-6]MCO4316367.1 hypothetical protein [Phyllobacterium sp. 21LDTY02-6]
MTQDEDSAKPHVSGDLAAHMSATATAFQMLVICLQNNGALERGQFSRALGSYIEEAAGQTDSATIRLLEDLKSALSD